MLLISQHFSWKNDNNEYEEINTQWLSDLRGEEAGSSANQALENASKIKWRGTKTDFAGLINVLIDNGCLEDSKQLNKLVSQHFLWMDKDEYQKIMPNRVADFRGKIKNAMAENRMDADLEKQLNGLLKVPKKPNCID